VKTLWLVGQFRAVTESGTAWDFQGIFETRELAVAACRNRNYGVIPVLLNEEVPDEKHEFQECIYPLIEAECESKSE
jgi:hypothetical protein